MAYSKRQERSQSTDDSTRSPVCPPPPDPSNIPHHHHPPSILDFPPSLLDPTTKEYAYFFSSSAKSRSFVPSPHFPSPLNSAHHRSNDAVSRVNMELGYDLLVSAFTALCFSFLVARLLSFALSGYEISGGNGEGKKSRVKVSKSRKKRIKKTSSSQEMSPIEDQDDQKRVLESVGEAVGVGNGDGVTSDGEEWEGIDRNELERDFAKAVSFVEKGGLDELGSGVMVQFYGLQKAAMGGDYGDEAKLAARTMWNAWPKFGSMNPEEAMEKYIALLSEKVPGWMEGHSPLEGKMKSEEDEACGSSETNSTCTYESKPGVEPATWTGDLAGQSSSVNKDEQ